MPIAGSYTPITELSVSAFKRAATAMIERTPSPILTLSGLGLVLAVSGCGLAEAPMLAPKGPITLIERDLLFTAFGLMLIVVIPVFVMAFVFVWFYRPVSKHDVYKPDWGYSVWMDGLVWLVPAAIVIAIGTLVWEYTHRLDPYRSIDSDKRPLEVQVVAQDWKWLFLYPEQGIATVNELAFPSERPLSLQDHLGYGDELVPDPGAGRPDLCHGGHGDPAPPAGRRAGPVRRPQHAVQRRRLRQPVFRGDRHVGSGLRGLGRQGPGSRRAGWMPPPTSNSPSPASSIR